MEHTHTVDLGTEIGLPQLAYDPELQDSDHTNTQATSEHSADPTTTPAGGYDSSDASSLALEKRESELPWAGYLDEALPEKKQRKHLRNLRHLIFTIYHRLFGVVFVVNLAVFIATLVNGTDANHLGTVVVSNIFGAVLMRQEYVINFIFDVFTAVPQSWPLWIRKLAARVYHLGGLHSGFATSGVVWLAYFTGQATKEMLDNGKTSIPTVAISYFILAFLIGIVVFAHPSFRSKYHNSFEHIHRFLGWASVALVWAQLVLLSNDYRPEGISLGRSMVKAAPFWLLVILTLSIALPWTRLRKVPVKAEVLSDHAVRLYFDYTNKPVPGSFARISDNPLFEWHSFATIAVPGEKGYSMVVSKAGDWTIKNITNPPEKIWVRGIPTSGALRVVPLFRRVVFIATGSGIGPFAPHILEKRTKYKLLWTAPNVRKTFGDKLVDTILEASPDAIVYDTRIHGKPDMVKLTYRLVREFDAEAVCVISNERLTKKVVYAMMSRGIPAFGAIWDS